MKKAIITIVVIATFAFALGACESEEEPEQSSSSVVSPVLPSNPKTRLAIRPNEDGSVSVFAQWFSSRPGAESWNRVTLSRVSAEQLAQTDECFNTQGKEVGNGTVWVRGVVCPVFRDGERRIKMYLQSRRPDATWSERQVLGEIGAEKQRKVGTTFFTTKFSYPVNVAYEPPVWNTRSPVRTASSADCGTLHNRAMAADRRAVTRAAGASERRAADAAWATYDRSCK